MKEKTIDYVLRATWMAVQKMYNEEAGTKGSTMATGFALISIDPEKGTPSTAFGKEMREFSKGVVLRFDEAVKEQVSEEDIKTFKKVASTITELISNKNIYKKVIHN